MKTELSTRGGANLRNIRKLRGLSAEELSARLMERYRQDISASAILKYESGDRPITQEHTAIFAACLDCSVAALMDGMDLSQPRSDTFRELRRLPQPVHEIFYWCATKWRGNIVALATAWGLYAVTPGRYRKYAMMELLSQKDRAIQDGALQEADIPACIRSGIPTVEELLGGLYDDEP